jgi:hypothetical protein
MMFPANERRFSWADEWKDGITSELSETSAGLYRSALVGMVDARAEMTLEYCC